MTRFRVSPPRTDCGYRMTRRVVKQGTAKADTCAATIDHDETPESCGDHTDYAMKAAGGFRTNEHAVEWLQENYGDNYVANIATVTVADNTIENHGFGGIDYVTRDNWNRCGRGTDKTQCATASTNRYNELEDMIYNGKPRPNGFPTMQANHHKGRKLYMQTMNRDKDIYVQAGAPGGCHDTCVWPDNVLSFARTYGDNARTHPLRRMSYPDRVHSVSSISISYSQGFNGDDTYAGDFIVNGSEDSGPFETYQMQALAGPRQVCTDGGEGSVRLPLRMPHGIEAVARNGYELELNRNNWIAGQTSLQGIEVDLIAWDFLCPYGTQCEACGPRPENLHRAVEDEVMQPSGPEVKLCRSVDGSIDEPSDFE